MYDVSSIKSRLSCRDYLSKRGIFITRDRGVSPLRPDATNPTSFHISEDGQLWYDFGLGAGGDVIDLCAEIEFGGDKGQAIRSLARTLGLDEPEDSVRWRDNIQQLCNRTAAYAASLTEADRQYLYSRHLSDEDITRLKIGRVTDGHLRGRLFLPYLSNGAVVYYATRAMKGGAKPDSKYMKASLKENPAYENIPWGLHTLNRPGHTLIIAEGYFDAVMWEQAGYPVISAITGRFSHAQEPQVLNICRMFDRVFIIYDTDRISHAGDNFTASMAELLINNHIPFIVGHTPDRDGIKDVNDYVCSGGNVLDLLNSAVDGLSYIASTKQNIDDLEHFILSASRHTSRANIAAALESCAKIFGKSVISEILAKVKRGPSEDDIATEITKKHELLYVPGLGFHEFNGHVWERLDEEQIRRYADSLYGPMFTTSTKTKSVANLLHGRVLSNAEFNRSPVITFANGTLEIPRRVFREFRSSDFCTIELPYSYDPTATAPLWESFVKDVSNNNSDRECLLQFMSGYPLFPDCSLQKFFLLQGEGGNGKSVFLDILSHVYGAANVTTITPAGLAQDFQRIHLKDSLVNIVSDVRPDFSKEGVREWTLKLCDGSLMSACYKGQDYVQFTPRAKLIYASNPIPYADVVAGLSRRFVFCRFERHYVENPDPANPTESKIDTELTGKLLKELSGIFNWCYDGYFDLVFTRKFPMVPEQAEMLEQFALMSDPIIAFCEDFDDSGEILRREIYDKYIAWCADTGHRQPVSRERFFPRFREVMGRRIFTEVKKRYNGNVERFLVINGGKDDVAGVATCGK